MNQLIFSAIGFVLWAIYIIVTYYSTSYSKVNHSESTSGYAGYLTAIIVIYALYKIYTLFFQEKKHIQFNFFHIVGFFLLQFFILCISYTNIEWVSNSPIFWSINPSSIVLLTHSIGLLIYPFVLTLIMRSTGYTLLSLLIENWKGEKLRARVMIETTVGFLVFTIGLLILGATWWYTLTGLLSLLGLLTVLSISGWKETYNNIFTASSTFENHDTESGSTIKLLAPRLVSVEIAFMAVSFLIGVSLINVIRPMPIGWDDLGVYMNFPKMMALSGEYLLGAGMYTWQLITGTGFLFSYTAAQAFYVNQIGGIFAVIAITSALSLIFENNKKNLLCLPLILATVFYVMPMNIFQQAKDMKLDPALLAMSISAFMMLFYLWKSEDWLKKRNLTILTIAWVLAGFVFTVKVTSLMLFLAGFGLIAYRLLSFSGFLGFFFLFLAIFTQGNLWSMMNIWMPVENTALINSISWGLLLLSIGSFISSFYGRYKETILENMYTWLLSSLIFLWWILIGISPWIIKNSIEAKIWIPNPNGVGIISAVLSGSGGGADLNFEKIYSIDEYNRRTEQAKSASITSSGQSQNEDFGRYFGYDSGINNYLKLPANLTFQKNQGGEFTDITFIFLALVPSLLLFVRGRRPLFAIISGLILLASFIYWFTKTGQLSLTNFFGWFTLPLGYGILVGMNLLYLTCVHFFIDESISENKRIKEILIVLWVYGFLFLISAFGIVWYGILVYFLFLVLIGLTSMSFTSYDEHDEKNEDLFSIKVTLSIILALFIGVYFVRSGLPHGWNNLKEAAYNEFKYNYLNQEESIFAYRQDYVTPISHMNIRDTSVLIGRIIDASEHPEMKKLFQSSELKNISINQLSSILFTLSHNKNQEIAAEAKRLGNMLYKNILYPTQYTPDLVNTGWIYRIGTFMTYLINDNRKRYYDDSLVFGFETYFYDPSPEFTIDRMKKMDFKYFLIDLNAATIDRDPRHALTTRFEKLLHTMKAKNMKLVDTDNICLELALDEYKKWKLQSDNDFIDLGWTNYESYRTQSGSEVVIHRSQKQNNCANYILKKLYQDKVWLEEYPYLAPIKQAIDNSNALSDQSKLGQILGRYAGQSWFALFEITDMPAEISMPVVSNTGTTNTGITVQ